jgi:hypothetical protein
MATNSNNRVNITSNLEIAQVEDSNAPRTFDGKKEKKDFSHVKTITTDDFIVYGFAITNAAECEVDSLLSLFSMIATIGAFLAGIQLGCLGSVGMQELEYANLDYNSDSNSRRLLFISATGAIFAALSVVISGGLYISLSSLSGAIASHDYGSDKMLVTWFGEYGYFYLTNLFSVYTSVFLLVTAVFYLGVLKFPALVKDSTAYGCYAALGFVLMSSILVGTFVAVRRHLKILSVWSEGKLKMASIDNNNNSERESKKVESTKMETTSSMKKSSTSPLFCTNCGEKYLSSSPSSQDNSFCGFCGSKNKYV